MALNKDEAKIIIFKLCSGKIHDCNTIEYSLQAHQPVTYEEQQIMIARDLEAIYIK